MINDKAINFFQAFYNSYENDTKIVLKWFINNYTKGIR